MMIRRPTVAVVLCVLAISFISRQANAELVLSFVPSSTTLLVGETLEVDVFLDDVNLANPQDSPLNPSSGQSFGGLYNFGFAGSIQTDAGSKQTDVLSLAAGNAFIVGTSQLQLTGPVTTNDPNPDDNLSFFSLSGTDSSPDQEPGAFGSPITDSDDDVIGFRLKLGTLVFTANGPSQSSALTFTNNLTYDFDISSSEKTFSELATSSTYPPSFTVQINDVNAVPEPGSMSLVALAGGGLWLARRRLRRAK